MDLTAIAGVVDAEHDPVEALRGHHRRLIDEQAWPNRLAATVAITIRHLKEETDMPAENLY